MKQKKKKKKENEGMKIKVGEREVHAMKREKRETTNLGLSIFLLFTFYLES